MLWLTAAFFLLGDLGKITDDWYYVQRDPVTGSIESLILERPVHFWRPLYRVVVPSVITLLSDHDWAAHLISGAAHGLVGLLLWRLFRDLKVPRLPASVAVLWFITWPSWSEAVLWECALPTLLSAGAVVLAWIVSLRWARGVGGGGMDSGGGGWNLLIVVLLFLVSACLNEQASCGVAALPALYMACRPPGEALRRSLLRAALCTGAAAAAVGVYIALHATLQYKMPAVAHKGFVIPLHEMPREVSALAGWMRGQLFSGGFLARLLEVGAETLREHPIRTVLFAALLLAGLLPWAKSVAAPEEARKANGFWVIGCGVLVVVSTLAPIVVFNYWLVSRITYAPALGMALLIAGIGCLGPPASAARRSRVRTAAACVLGLALIAPAIMMVGFQHGYQSRARRDAHEVGQLRNLLPTPAEATVFVPVRVDFPPVVKGGAGRFDNSFGSALTNWWSARWIIRAAFKRRDLECGHIEPGHQGAIVDIGAVGPNVLGVGEVAWERVVPFILDSAGEVHLVTSIRRGDAVFVVPQTSRAAESRGLAALEMSVP